MGSGSTSLASELRGAGFDVSHEGVEGGEGTVSWIHILQLLPRSPSKIVELCESWESHAWHPVLFAGENGGYSKLCGPDIGDKYSKSRECWKGVCRKVLEGNCGCDEKQCDVEFEKFVGVVRDPAETINTLSHKFCPTSRASSSGQLRVASILLDFELEESLECWQGWAKYWTAYYRMLLERRVTLHRREGLDVCKIGMGFKGCAEGVLGKFWREIFARREKVHAFMATGKWDDVGKGLQNSRGGTKKKKLKIEDMGEVGMEVMAVWSKIKML
ncbi:hypothetical protein TrVE_jg8618 [Triparma verrucosa]|uniref:Uncharacterized protein n=1 Tax=Triparma verrucosa TaxID=1606542 RepID=A0A9W7FG92_9STRA|nr:hypothetical protein TrVE_jg8618 [Triparma verrucosa]